MAQPASYFAAHLPLYPLTIRLFKELMSHSLQVSQLAYLKSMLLVNIFATVGLAWLFYFILKKIKITKEPLLLTIIFLFLPRLFIVRSVGAPESLFLLLILGSLYFFEKGKYLLAGLLGGLVTMTKSPGILLFGAYCLVFAEKLLVKKKNVERLTPKISWLWIALIPAGLLAVFMIYWKQMGDFFAYFNSGDNIHLIFPFSVFNFKMPWVGTAWLEDVIFYFLLYGLTVISLLKSKQRSFFYFSLVFFVATLFIQHRDIGRYSLPLWPLALIAHEKFFTSKKFIVICIILLPAIYLYAWNFLGYNIMPIADWTPYL